MGPASYGFGAISDRFGIRQVQYLLGSVTDIDTTRSERSSVIDITGDIDTTKISLASGIETGEEFLT